MPICTNCKNKWSWKQTVKKTMTLGTEMSCPFCGEKQYQSKTSKKKAPLLSLIILLPLLIQVFFDVPVVVLLSLIPVLAVTIFIFYPYLVELSGKEEFPY